MAAFQVSQQLAARGQHVAANAMHLVATNAFIEALRIACVVAGAVAIAGALLAAFLPAQPPDRAVTADDDVAEATDRSESHVRLG